MTITQIVEIENSKLPKIKPIKEKMNIFIPDIDKDLNIPNRNGFHLLMCGSGGSGKSSLMMNMMKNKNMYRNKFNTIHYFCPMVSFLSVDNHPFKKHDRIYHDLNVDILYDIFKELQEIKESSDEQQYHCIILDDMADCYKSDKELQKLMNKMMIKSRHLGVCWIITLQAYYYFPKLLRRQITNLIQFKTKSVDEFIDISKELFNFKEEDALKLYNYCFDENYNHLDVDTVINQYYKNFNLLEIKTQY